ncbi:MAG TPA: nitronate monooxygenase [Gaiellaceae bacterium]|nr:nitronate monooxygenase [Gaiellaceae bacterium]
MSGIRTAFTELVGIEHPVVSAGMGGGAAGGELAGAVSEAGALGIVGASWLTPERMQAEVERARTLTSKPIGINVLLFGNEDLIEPLLELEPAVLSTAWPRDDQDLRALFSQAHDRGVKVMHMVTALPDAVAAAEAGADVIVAQGTEGGGHVGEIGTTVVVRQVVKAVAPVPVLAAGGFADGAGLASALGLGADGVLLGTRFLASAECDADAMYKDAVVACESEDTVLTTVLDSLSGRDWPGAWSRAARTRFVEEWLGREPELRRRRAAVRARLAAAVEDGDVEYQALWLGQSAGLVDSVEPAGELVHAIVAEAEAILRDRLPALLR